MVSKDAGSSRRLNHLSESAAAAAAAASASFVISIRAVAALNPERSGSNSPRLDVYG